MFYVLSTLITGAGMLLGILLFPQYRTDILIGCILPWANAAAAFAFMSRSLHGTSTRFAYAAIANIGLRLLIMLVVFAAVLVLLPVNELVFIIALFFSYICNSILETIYLQRLKPKN